MKVNIEQGNVRTTSAAYGSIHGDDHAFVTVTEWENGEGADVHMNEAGCVSNFQMTLDQWTALKKAMKAHLERP